MWQPGKSLAEVEKEVILKALSFYHGNKAQTARSLQIAPNTLSAKLDQYNGKLEEAPAPTPKKAKASQ